MPFEFPSTKTARKEKAQKEKDAKVEKAGKIFDKKLKKLLGSKETQLQADSFEKGNERAEARAAKETMQEFKKMAKGGMIKMTKENREKFVKNLKTEAKKASNRKKFKSPMARQRKIDTMKDKAEKRGGTFFTMDEMMPLKTLTSKGPGELKQMAKGGRAGLKGGGICKKGMNPEARGKNS